MRPVLIDTNAYVAFKRRDARAIEMLRRAEVIAVSVVVVGELLAGFECGSRKEQNRVELEQFLGSSRVKIYPITSNTTQWYAKIFYSLKRKGTPIPTNDLWIAAQALEHGCIVHTYDSHFESIDGLLIGRAPDDLFPY